MLDLLYSWVVLVFFNGIKKTFLKQTVQEVFLDGSEGLGDETVSVVIVLNVMLPYRDIKLSFSCSAVFMWSQILSLSAETLAEFFGGMWTFSFYCLRWNEYMCLTLFKNVYEVFPCGAGWRFYRTAVAGSDTWSQVERGHKSWAQLCLSPDIAARNCILNQTLFIEHLSYRKKKCKVVFSS